MPVLDVAASEQDSTEELSGSTEENKLYVEEELVPAQPPSFKVHMVNGRAISRSKCRRCGSGSSSNFYRSGSKLYRNTCFYYTVLLSKRRLRRDLQSVLATKANVALYLIREDASHLHQR